MILGVAIIKGRHFLMHGLHPKTHYPIKRASIKDLYSLLILKKVNTQHKSSGLYLSTRFHCLMYLLKVRIMWSSYFVFSYCTSSSKISYNSAYSSPSFNPYNFSSTCIFLIFYFLCQCALFLVSFSFVCSL